MKFNLYYFTDHIFVISPFPKWIAVNRRKLWNKKDGMMKPYLRIRYELFPFSRCLYTLYVFLINFLNNDYVFVEHVEVNETHKENFNLDSFPENWKKIRSYVKLMKSYKSLSWVSELKISIEILYRNFLRWFVYWPIWVESLLWINLVLSFAEGIFDHSAGLFWWLKSS